MEQPVTETKTERSALQEALAAECYAMWRGWVRHLFENSELVTMPSGIARVWLSVELQNLWARQMEMPYDQLTDEMKAALQVGADKLLALFGKFQVENPDRTIMQAIGRAEAEGIAFNHAPLRLSDNLPEALTYWRAAEILASTARLRADEASAKAVLQASLLDFVTPEGAKLTNEAARKAWAMLQSRDEELDAQVLEANARALGWWAEKLAKG